MKECVVFVSFCVAGVRPVLNEIIIIFCANSGHTFFYFILRRFIYGELGRTDYQTK